MWCGAEIMKDPTTGAIWSQYEGRWFVLRGPDPQYNAWSREVHQWALRRGPPAHFMGMEEAGKQQGDSALAEPPGEQGQPQRGQEHEIVD